MKTPPRCVVVQARYHWLMSLTILLGVAGVFFFTRETPGFGISRRGYVISLAVAGVYALTGGLLWIGFRPGLVLHHLCSMIYLTRPRMGQQVWDEMRSEEFKAHFRKG